MKKNEINNEGVALYLPIKMDAVTEMRFEQNYGTHAVIEIKGILHTEEEVENAYEMDMKDKILLKKKDKILFSGVPGKTVVQKKGNIFFVHITGYSRSILLDMEKKKKSFQKNTTYQSILEEKVGSGGILKMQSSLEGKEKKQLYVQYRETDWEFMKRLASQIHAQICPDITVEKTCVMVGVPKGKERNTEVSTYELEKDMAGFLKYEKQEQFVKDKQFLTLTFQSYKIYKIGDMVSFEEYHFSIVGVSMKYIDGMLQYTYTLRHKNGMNCRKQYHSKICGASIDGKIIKVQRDDVKLHLKIDAGQPVSEALFFKVAIDYTAEGSTGLYTAMDEGESVKLYFPSANEKDAYVRCVDKNDRETNEYFTKPTTQCYGTPYGSCMRTKEDEILISAVQDEMYIQMDEEDGIEIRSSENIDIYSEKDITINCKQLKIQSEDKILLQTGEDLIIVDETIYMDCNL